MENNTESVLSKVCPICGKQFFKKYNEGYEYFTLRKVFCGISCSRKNRKASDATKQKMSNTHKRIGNKPPSKKGIKWSQESRERRIESMKGERSAEYSEKCRQRQLNKPPATLEFREKMSIIQKEIVKSGKHHLYKGGITSENHRFRTSLEYKLWRESVFKRDNYICQSCGAKSGNGVAVYLEAHHIKSFASHPELRLDITNGVTWCKECHKTHDAFRGKRKNHNV